MSSTYTCSVSVFFYVVFLRIAGKFSFSGKSRTVSQLKKYPRRNFVETANIEERGQETK